MLSDIYKVIDLYNETCPMLQTAITIDDKCKLLIYSRMQNNNIDEIKTAFQKAAKSEFLAGNNKTGWKPGIEWLLQPGNFEKILAGKYDKYNNVLSEREKREEKKEPENYWDKIEKELTAYWIKRLDKE